MYVYVQIYTYIYTYIYMCRYIFVNLIFVVVKFSGAFYCWYSFVAQFCLYFVLAFFGGLLVCPFCYIFQWHVLAADLFVVLLFGGAICF